MDLLLASRQSDLARLQAYQVGEALQKKGHKIQYHFRDSLGDINQEDPLWKMPEKGVFTEDFREGLIQGQWDLVVHSWKDLPIDPLPQTEIFATLPRADRRDVFLMKKSRLQKTSESLHVFSSSPRRAYNLTPFFKKSFPQPLQNIQFHDVRGNILTRVRKLMESSQVDGLVVAKAALDRLLTVQGEEFVEGQHELLGYIQECVFQVIPLSQNPTAAAQGALAVEIKKNREDLKAALSEIHCEKTWQEAQQERRVLKSYGGGCHQKIGVSTLKSESWDVQFLRGETESGEVLEDHSSSYGPLPLQNPCRHQPSLFDREPVDFQLDPKVTAHFITRANTVPKNQQWSPDHLIWASGMDTWSKLAAQGHWVSGCSDSLGEERGRDLGPLVGDRHWYRWTHDLAPERGDKKNLVTYRMIPKAETEPFGGYGEYYWMSGTQFQRALELEPSILQARHYCGPGQTYNFIKEMLQAKGIKNPPQPLPSRRIWLQAIEDHKK